MKKVITPVGTSLFENFLKSGKADENFIRKYEYFKNKKIKAEGLEGEEGKKSILKNALNENWFKENIDASAEIKSLIKIKNKLNDDIRIYLIHSDTALSKLASEILVDSFKYYNDLKNSKVEVKGVNGLQIWDSKEFVKGMAELIKLIYHISGGYWDDVVINITGGFKATVPYLTILGQINKCDIYYVFERTEALIKIPYIPIDINWGLIERYEKFLMELEKVDIKRGAQDISEEIEILLEVVDDMYCLNPLGVTLWEKYKSMFRYFYIFDDVKDEVKKRKNLVEKSLLELDRRLRNNPNDRDLDHKVKNLDTKVFKIFKHKEDNLQVRILYRTAYKEKTIYGIVDYDILIASIAVGNEVHNAGSESEYIEKFERVLNKEGIFDSKNYEIYKIQVEGKK
jgi:putative CRISPR-associated protein (TIGR02619 family)